MSQGDGAMNEPSADIYYCECIKPGECGGYIWRDDPEWVSCMCCDGRVRRLTDEELKERGPR